MIGVSLFRRPNRRTGSFLPGYYCAFRITGADGKQRQINRQTGKTTKREAEAFAVALRESILKEAGAGEEKSARIYAALQEAADRAARHELTADMAREFLARFTEIESGKAIRGYTIAQWLDFWLENKKVAAKPATLARYKNAVARFKSHLGTRAADRLESLAGTDVQKFRDNLRAEGRSAKTTNGYLTRHQGDAPFEDVKLGVVTDKPRVEHGSHANPGFPLEVAAHAFRRLEARRVQRS